ncbi:MAG: carbon-nitrogen hydrolase family protein [Solirubrobacteraceae bacterium]
MSPAGFDLNDAEPFLAAAVQAAPVYLDADATIEKAISLIERAAAAGARLVAFPEAFVPGYPYWNWIMSPIDGSAWFQRLVLASVDVPGRHVAALQAAARASGTHVVIGVNERSPHSAGSIYNSVLTIDDGGQLIGVHRKLVPTWAEKLTWAHGDGSSLRVHNTSLGPLGVLAGGENTNPLARYALLAQGELIHVASYISLPVAPADYDMVAAIRLRAMTHSFEGKVFTIVACSTISPEIVDAVAGQDERRRALMSRSHSAFSGVCGPDGRFLGDELVDREGIAYAQIDLRRCIQPKQMHDIVGHYNRFDVFRLQIDDRPQAPAWFASAQAQADAANPIAGSSPAENPAAGQPPGAPKAQISEHKEAHDERV